MSFSTRITCSFHLGRQGFQKSLLETALYTKFSGPEDILSSENEEIRRWVCLLSLKIERKKNSIRVDTFEERFDF